MAYLRTDNNINLHNSDMVGDEVGLYFLAERAMEMKDECNVMPILAEMLRIGKAKCTSTRPRRGD